jgi:hypothetical protein
MLILVLVLVLFFILVSVSSEKFSDKIPCIKWIGNIENIENSPDNICKDCGFPVDCHGPYMGESWRHIFKET